MNTDQDMTPTETSSFLEYKAALEDRIKEGPPAPKDPDCLPLDSITVIPTVFQHREDSQWASDDHIKTLVKSLKNSTKGTRKKPLEPLTVFWVGDRWVLIDGHHRYKAYREIKHTDAVPVIVFSGTLDEAIGQALKGNSKDKLPMSKSEKTNAAWRLVISTKLSLSHLVDASTISKPTIIKMKRVREHLEAAGLTELDSLMWREAWAQYQGKEEVEFVPDFEWHNKRIMAVAQTLSETFGGQFKRKPEIFWESVRKYDSNLIDYFLEMHGVDPEDYSFMRPEPNDF